MKKLLLALTMVGALSGCDTVDSMKKEFEHTTAVSSSLEKSVGVKNFVGFKWRNGSLTSVNITFKGVPQDMALPDILNEAKIAVRREFRQTPKQIIVAFSVSP